MAKILVAEDERDIRELVVDTLFDRGSDVFEAGPFQNDSDLVFRGVLLRVLVRTCRMKVLVS